MSGSARAPRRHVALLAGIGFGVGLAFVPSSADAQTVSASASPSGSMPPPADAPPTKDEEPSYDNGVYADLSLGVLGIAYERVLHETFALNIAAQYWRPWYQSDHVFGFGGELRGFLFMIGDAPQGIYVSPGLRLHYARADLEDDTTEEGFAFGARTTVGGSVVLWDLLLLRAGIGVQTTRADLVEPGSAEPDFGGPFVAADAYAGFVF